MTIIENDIYTLKKLNTIVKDKLPKFASRYFDDNIDTKTPGTLLGYARDLNYFFEYLKSISYEVDTMTLSDLNSITPEIVENYLEYSKSYMDHGVIKTRSECAIKRRYSSLSSFLEYFNKHDLIDYNPVNKVTPPRPNKRTTETPSNSTNWAILDFIRHGSLEGNRKAFQKYNRVRDYAITILFIGAGLNASEISNLNIEDVNLEENLINVRMRKSIRIVYISDTVSKAIGEYLNDRLETITEYGHENALFLSIQHKRIGVRSLEKMIKKYSEAFFDGNHHLTPEILKQSFRNNVFEQSNNVYITSVASRKNMRYVLDCFRSYVDDYECQKGKDFFLPHESF